MFSSSIGVSATGKREIEMHQPSVAAAITSTITTPVVSAVLIKIGPICFHSSVR